MFDNNKKKDAGSLVGNDWAQAISRLNGCIRGYVDFLVPCYAELCRHGIPPREAAVMASRALEFHVHFWTEATQREQEKTPNLADAFLQAATPQGEH